MYVYTGFAMVEAQFESILTFHEGIKKHVSLPELFDVLDNDQDGRIDGLEIISGIALCCEATFEEKSRFCFELFDFNLNASLSQKELVMMMMSTVCGMNVLSGGGEENEFDLETFERLAEDAFSKADRDQSGSISFDEFVVWARSNRDMMSGIEKLHTLALEAKNNMDSEDSAAETEEGSLSDAEPVVLQKNIVRKKRSQKKKLSVPTGGDMSEAPDDQIEESWKNTVFEPTNYRRSKKERDGPETNMDLEWVFGASSQTIKGCARYVIGDGEQAVPKFVVFAVAAVAVVYDLEFKTQTFYQGHSEEITAIALHPSGRIVATADSSAAIHVWDPATLAKITCIRGVVLHGYQHLIFCPTGDRLCTVGLDYDHTVTIYDCATSAIVSSGKGISDPDSVNGIAYSSSGSELAIVGKGTIIFFKGVNTKSRALVPVQVHIGRLGKIQTFFCVAYHEEVAIVGCAGGELYRFVQGECTEVVQAHGLKDPVLCIHYSALDGCFVTGGKDGLVKTWDPTLKEIGQPLDLAEDLDGDGNADNGTLDKSITSVQLFGNRILVATKSSDIFEAIMPSKPTAKLILDRVAWGHYTDELNGLAVHPFLDEFATSGDDKTLRTWDIRGHAQISCKSIPEKSRAVAYSNSGEIICIGMEDGSIALLTTTALKGISKWQHTEQAISDIKFSPDDTLLAAGSTDGNIYLYRSDDKRTYRRLAVCHGHTDGVTHIDFSSNGKFLQSNGGDDCIMYWDMKGTQIKSNSSMRDTVWFTWTCTLGWPAQVRIIMYLCLRFSIFIILS